MTTSGQDEPKQQNFYGSGPSFGGDNIGTINNVLLDPKTKATLAKLSKDAPALADVLKTALRDGVISPDTVAALQSAVQSINHDVADRLWYAAQRINGDVADRLWYAGKNINGVAEKFDGVNISLKDAARELDLTLTSLREMVGQLTSSQRGSNLRFELEPTRITTGSPRQTFGARTMVSSRKWRFIATLICCSTGVGLLAAVIIMRSHQGGYAVLAGIVMLAVAALLRFGARW